METGILRCLSEAPQTDRQVTDPKGAASLPLPLLSSPPPLLLSFSYTFFLLPPGNLPTPTGLVPSLDIYQ